MKNIQVDTRGSATSDAFHEDHDGFNMPDPPGTASRRIPLGDFPTGPGVGEHLPDIVALDQHGKAIDVHVDRDGGPAVVVFYRSAVW